MTKPVASVVSELRPRITVIGVGGAGCNAVNNMITSGLSGVSYVAANTDAQALAQSSAEQRLQLGVNLTEGLGAGSKPEIGEAAAEEAIDDIKRHVAGSHMVFIAAGMGGGTGTGAASVIARVARESGALTVAIVSKPFHFEGARRMRIALQGIEHLRKAVDTLIVIPNQNLFRLATNRTTFAEAFQMADQVLYSGIACIVDLILKDGLINLDFADVRTIMSGMGTAVMGTGEATGERRATLAAEEAISNPLLEDVTLTGARGVLLSIIGGSDLTLYEVDEAASRVRQEVDSDANIIVGATFDPSLGDRVRVSIVATGMDLDDVITPVPDATMPAQPVARGNEQVAPALPPPLPAAQSAHVRADQAPAQRDARSAQSGGNSRQMPPPPPRNSGSDPYLGDTNAEDFARALSAALAESNPSSGPRVPAPPPREVWQGPDGVTIETGPGVARQAPRHQVEDRRETHVPPPAQSKGFVAAAPADVLRTPPRMPTVDDFPAVGQRAYHGQREAQAAEHTSRQGDHRQAVKPDPQASQPQSNQARKPNLFERITGLRARGDSQAEGVDSYPQDVGTRSQPHQNGTAQNHTADANLNRKRG